ncbi:TP901 family phage tail tape measure protein [Moryella indoligenes]|uniref:TP901 family phage tail tape measure protein n=1 Tax=Moryella indoligenes TaxID=371674 RepID=A0AAE3VBR8_9FIRM|nr:phage tail tape measure protein [Moryella indoligenes]MDQ0153404.1 TP901 family phage tail tape measure protein [Moryella indoligenes]
MAGNGKALELSIKIAGKMDHSLAAAIKSSQSQISSFSRSMSKVGKTGLVAMGALAVGTVAAIATCTKEAESFEKQMGDVVKYVDGLADAHGKISNTIAKETKNGKTYAENYKAMSEAILDLSTQIPMTAEDLTRLAAAAGQSGKSMEELIQRDMHGNINGFLKDMAMVGTAWDISADQAGDYGAKWEKAFNMNHDQIMVLADQINYLGANSATTAAEIAQVVNETGSYGQIAGIDVKTTAAFADAMLASGVAADRAGTGVKRIYKALASGEKLSKPAREAFAQLGLDAQTVAENMQLDSVNTMLDVFKRIHQYDPAKQVGILSTLFGQWAVEGSSKIVGNMQTFIDALEMVNDPNKYNGSMLREFIIKSGTSDSINTMMQNSFKALKIDFGTAFLPAKKEFSLMMIGLMNRIRKNMPELSKLAETISRVMGKGAEKLGDGMEKALPYVQKFFDYIEQHGDKVLEVLGGLAGMFATMTFAPKIEGIARGAGSLLFGKSGGGKKSGGLFGAFGGMSKGLAGVPASVGGVFNAAKIGAEFGGSGSLTTGKSKGGLFDRLSGAAIGIMNHKSLNTEGLSDQAALGRYMGVADKITGFKKGGGITGALMRTAPMQYFGNIVSGASAVKNASGIGGMAQAGVGLLGGIMSPATGMLGGLLTTGLPIAGAITGVIALVSILGDHLDDIRGIIQNTFGDAGVAVFDTVMGKIQQVGDFISGLFKEGGVAEALAPLKEAITGMFGEDAGAAFGGLEQIIQSVMTFIGQLVSFATGTVKPILLEIFSFITTTVVPKVLAIFTAAAPYISSILSSMGNVIMSVLEMIGEGIKFLMPIIKAIVSKVLDVATVVVPIVLSYISGLWEGIEKAFKNIKGAFDGVIQFITGVFSGNLEQALEGVKNIFVNVFEAIKNLVKAPINAVTGAINAGLDKLNGKTVLGMKVNIPKIPKLANGGFTNGTSIAGEAGREAVISFRNSVRSANIATWMKAGEMLGMNRKRREVSLKSFRDSSSSARADGGSQSPQYIFSPQYNIQGNADEETLHRVTRVTFEDFERFMNQYEANKRRLSLARG